MRNITIPYPCNRISQDLNLSFLWNDRECPHPYWFPHSPPFDRHVICFEFQTEEEEETKKTCFQVSSTCAHQKKSRCRSVQCEVLQFVVCSFCRACPGSQIHAISIINELDTTDTVLIFHNISSPPEEYVWCDGNRARKFIEQMRLGKYSTQELRVSSQKALIKLLSPTKENAVVVGISQENRNNKSSSNSNNKAIITNKNKFQSQTHITSQ